MNKNDFTNNLTSDYVPMLICHSNKMFNNHNHSSLWSATSLSSHISVDGHCSSFSSSFLTHTHTKMVYANIDLLQNQYIDDV